MEPTRRVFESANVNGCQLALKRRKGWQCTTLGRELIIASERVVSGKLSIRHIDYVGIRVSIKGHRDRSLQYTYLTAGY